jgi:hypothetical protein
MGASYSVYLKPFVAGFVAYATYRWLSGSPAVSKDDVIPESKAEPVKTEQDIEVKTEDKKPIKSVEEVLEEMVAQKLQKVHEDKKTEEHVEEVPEEPEIVEPVEEVTEDKKTEEPVEEVTEDKKTEEPVKEVTEEPEVIVTLEFDNNPRLAVSPSPMIPPVLSLPVLDTDDKDSPKEPNPVVELKETPQELDAAEKQDKAVRALILPTTGRAVEEIPMTDTVTSTRSWIYDTPWAPTEPLSGDRAILFADDAGVEPAHHMGPSLFGAPYSGGRRDVYR